MSFVSEIRSGELIVTDHNAAQVAATDVWGGMPVSRGLIPRDRSVPTPYMQPWKFQPIPRSEWAGIIEHKERTRTRLSDLCSLMGVKTKDQDGLPYCWVFATVFAVEAARASMGLPYVSLSPASVGAPIKGYKRQGGWGSQALEYIIEHGVVPSSMWADCALDRALDNAETQAKRKLYRCTEWYDLPANDFDAVATCCLLNIPVSIGLNWWGHQVCAIDLVVLSPGKYGIRIKNSWGDGWGENGYGILNESKGTPDDACAPLVMLASL